MSDKSKIIRYIYLYLVSAITIVMIIIATVGFINTTLKEYVFDIKDWNEFDYAYQCDRNPDKTLTEEETIECKGNSKIKAAEQSLNETKKDLVWDLSMLIVALPLYLYHWRLIRKEK